MSLLKKQNPSMEEGKVLKAASYIPAWTTNNIQKFVETESKNVILIDICFQRPGKNIDNDVLRSHNPLRKLKRIYLMDSEEKIKNLLQNQEPYD